MWISVFDLMSDRKLIRPGAGVMPRILDIGIWPRIEGIYYRRWREAKGSLDAGVGGVIWLYSLPFVYSFKSCL